MEPRSSPLRLLALLATLALAQGATPASRFVTVNGARLEYLDWGGKGPPLVFLAGLGGTAHVFIDLAPAFVATHHSIALTRRGFGQSEQTAGGYELDKLVEDIAAFAHALDLQSVTLAGHSYGGTEAIRASELHPELIHRVILLDTAYDRIPSAAPPAETKLIAALTRMTQAEQMSSMDAHREYAKRLLGFWSGALEADMRETVIVASDGSIRNRTPGRISSEIASGRAQGKWPTKIPCPALLIFAQHSWADQLPGLRLDDAAKAKIIKAGAELQAARRSQIEAFRRDAPLAKIVELEHTDHHCFIQRRERVEEEMRVFLGN